MSTAAPMPTLPALCELREPEKLLLALTTLFETSPVLKAKLVPGLLLVTSDTDAFASYDALIERALDLIRAWPSDERASFIGGHPRIGEVKNLSALSAAEQARRATPPAVLKRLAQLNALYERRYPGLVYITFVNGRSRAEIADEMEAKLRDAQSRGDVKPVDKDEWESELERAVDDIGKIAMNRLSML